MDQKTLVALAGITLLALARCTPEREDLAAGCPTQRTAVERFSLCLTKDWHATTEQYGDNGNLVVYVQPAGSTGALMQIHVKKDPLQEPVRSSLSFAQRAIEVTRDLAPNYTLIRTEPLMIDRNETLLHVFEASPDAESTPVRYDQFVTQHGGIAYGFTAVMRPGIDGALEENLLTILRSVRFE